MDDDNALHDVDLSAWDVPDPAAGFADAVHARISATAAVEPAMAARRWTRIGGAIAAVAVVAAAAAVAVLVVGRGATHPAPASGEVVAIGARHLDLDTTWAELDPGAHVTWHRDGGELFVEQQGAATWTVVGDRLRITTGAKLAPVQATGASLRVEAPMNRMDARLFGTSAVTAAAVAMTTILVFRGHVTIGDSTPAVVIAPGSSVELRPGTLPQPLELVGVRDRIARLEGQVAELSAQLAVGGGPTKVPPTPPPAPDPAATPSTVDRTPCDASVLTQHGKIEIQAGQYEQAVASLEQSLQCKADPALYRLVVLAACDAGDAAAATAYAAKLPASQQAALSMSCARNHIKLGAAAVPSCDAAALAQRGKDAISSGKYESALTSLEAAMKCVPDPSLYRMMVLAACNSNDAVKARLYFDQLPVAQRAAMAQVCVRNRIPLP